MNEPRIKTLNPYTLTYNFAQSTGRITILASSIDQARSYWDKSVLAPTALSGSVRHIDQAEVKALFQTKDHYDQ